MKLLPAIFLVMVTVALSSVAGPAKSEATSELNKRLLGAAREGDSAAVKRLLEAGADVNGRTEYGVTPLLYAASKGHLETVRILVGAGADPHVKDTFYGYFPLSSSAYHGHREVLQFLLAEGATNVAEALISAVYGEERECAEDLLRAGVKPLGTLDEMLPVAKAKGLEELSKALEQHGALEKERLARFTGRFRKVGGNKAEDGTEIRLKGHRLQWLAGDEPVGLERWGEREFRSAAGWRLEFAEGAERCTLQVNDKKKEIYERVE